MIIVHENKIDAFMPAAYVLMTGKQQLMYEAVLSNLKLLLRQYDPNFTRSDKIITDFEVSLMNTLQNTFIGVSLDVLF